MLRIAIDASRNRSFGAISHLINIIKYGNPKAHNINEVHLWTYKKLLNSIPDKDWLVKHRHPDLEKNLIKQILWQLFKLPTLLKKERINVLFATDAATLCNFNNMVVMNQDLLPYEPTIVLESRNLKFVLRNIVLHFIQNRAFKNASSVIFLTNYAAEIIRKLNHIENYKIINHGVNEDFFLIPQKSNTPSQIINLIYISPILSYKNHINVIDAVNMLSDEFNVQLSIIGSGDPRLVNIMLSHIKSIDQRGKTFKYLGFIKNENIPKLLAKSDIFIFASRCEAFGITLLEGMASGLPIACSNRSALPELLSDCGLFFEASNNKSIAESLRLLIKNPVLRIQLGEKARFRARKFQWAGSANSTWEFLANQTKY